MAERFRRIYTLPCRHYQEGSPILIEAGAPLQDTVTGKILVQLKLQNIQNKPIKMVQRREIRAGKWVIQELNPVDRLDNTIAEGYTETWDLTDRFGVTKHFIKNYLLLYPWLYRATGLYFLTRPEGTRIKEHRRTA